MEGVQCSLILEAADGSKKADISVITSLVAISAFTLLFG